MSQAKFIRTTTILPVGDIHDAVAWYERALGMTLKYVHGQGRRGEREDFANYAILSRDGVEVHLILDEQGPTWTRAGSGHLSLMVSDVDEVFEHAQRQGVAIERTLQKENWPARGFNLRDPSGNSVHVEQPE